MTAHAAVLAAGDLLVSQEELESVPNGRLVVGYPEGGPAQVWWRGPHGTWSRPTASLHGVQTADLPALEWVLIHDPSAPAATTPEAQA